MASVPTRNGSSPIRLFGAPPARIAAQVGVGRAHHQPALMELVVGPARLVSLFRAACFSSSGSHVWPSPCDCGNCVVGVTRPASAPSSRPAQRQAVQPLHMVRPNDAEARNGGIGAQHRQLLLQRHALDQVGDALFHGKLRVLIGQELGRRRCCRGLRGCRGSRPAWCLGIGHARQQDEGCCNGCDRFMEGVLFESWPIYQQTQGLWVTNSLLCHPERSALIAVILSVAKDPCISPLPDFACHPERSEGPLYFAFACLCLSSRA